MRCRLTGNDRNEISVSYIPDTDIPKISKLLSKYVEFPEFERADYSKGYYCASCSYFWKEHEECAIVESGGESSDGASSGRIASYGMCGLWKPNYEEITQLKK